MRPFNVEAMRRAHSTLLDDLHHLGNSVRPDSNVAVLELCDQLGAARDHIASHFRLEEQDGYMAAIVKRQPRLDRAVRELAADHEKLLNSLDAVIQEAGIATAIDDRLRNRVTAWLESVHQHEDRENRLVEEAFDQDIGPND